MEASRRGHTATVQALLEAGADPSIRDKVLFPHTPAVV
jgi:ankyrin repeat protein